MTDHRTIVFGLDGACFDLIGPWLDAGALPTLASLIERGGHANLESCVPATTPPAWTSLTTGVNPGKHGIFGFYRRERGTYDISPVSDEDVGARRLWDYLTEVDQTTLAVNVPVTHPARELDGALVPGYLSPDPPQTYPDGLLDELGMDDYRVYADSETDGSGKQLLGEWLELTGDRRDLTLALADRYNWDLLFVEFQKTDGAVHKFTDDRAMVRQIFERVDACIADVLDAVSGDPNVFVVSDHGIGQAKEYSVALNTWLVEQGYAETTTEVNPADTSWLEQGAAGAGDADSSSAVTALFGALGRVGVTKQRLERALSRVDLYDLAVRLAPEGAGAAMEREVIDRSASTAFYEGMGFSGVDVGVLLNEARYYYEGTVEAADYEAVRADLLDALAAMEGPDGQRPFQSVQPREAVYEGTYAEEAPDIVLQQSPEYVIGSKYPRGQTYIPTDPGRIDHTRHGLLVAAGPDVVEDWSLAETPHIVDVTPTLLHLLETPLNDRFDGGPLEAVLAVDHAPEWRSYDPIERYREATMTADEEAALEDRLRGMGYLE